MRTLLFFAALMACAPVATQHASLATSFRLEALNAGHDQSDERTQFRLLVGERAYPEPVLGASEFDGQILVLRLDERLETSTGQLVAEHVAMMPIVHGGELFFVQNSDLQGRLYSLPTLSEPPRVRSELLASIGAMNSVQQHLFFVGARNSGVAGIWEVTDVARCLSNCELRTGTPWRDAFVPPPTDWSLVSLDGTTLRYVDEDGIERRVMR